MERPKRELVSVTRDEFRRDPGKVWDRVEREGSVTIVDAQGRARSVLHAMRDDAPESRR